MITLCTGLYFSAIRCNDEVAAIEGQGLYYYSLATYVDNLLAKVAPLPSVIPGSAFFGTGTLTDFGACLAVRSTLQVSIGYFLPAAVLFAEECISRNNFENAFLRRVRFMPRPVTLIMQHLLVVPFQAVVAFQAIVSVLNLVAPWAPALASALQLSADYLLVLLIV